MMKKTAALLLCLLMVVSLAACSASPAPTQPATTPAATTDAIEEHFDLIPFVKDGEIYFDIHVTDAIKNFAVKVDGQAVESGKGLTFTDKTQITFEGEADADKSLDMYVIFGVKDGNYYRFNQSISNGIDADRAMERLPKVISDVLSGNNKILVILTEKPGDWDHSLSEKLNEFLTPLVGK
ncbi:MAG: hypothetical protein J5493_03130 [Lachnospiraceae bacterium]|nr:hypothetical protein [Lachnospiraceae bacterium]